MAIVAAYAGMCLIWGTTWLGIKIGLHTLSPLMGVGLRFLIAGAVLSVVALLCGKAKPLREYPWRVIVVLAILLFGFNYYLNYLAETRLDSGLVSVLFGTMPFFTFAFASTLIGERVSPLVWAGAVFAFAGIAVLSLTGEARGSIFYALCSIVAAATAAYANVYAKKHSQHDPLVTLPPSMLLAGFGCSILGFVFERTQWSAVFTPESIGALLYLAIFGSSIAFFLLLWLLARIPAYATSLSTLIFPIIALVVGAAFGGEHLGVRELIGSALVIGGLALTFIPVRAPRSVALDVSD